MANQKRIFLIFYSIILTLTITIAVMLLSQYRYFKKEAYDLSLVKEAYYQHVEMLKRSLNASIAQENEEESVSDLEKKKEIESDLIQIELSYDNSEEEESASQFEIISQEEEDRLKVLKAAIPKTEIVSKIKKRKNKVRKVLYKTPRHKTRYEPQRDFSFDWPIDLNNFWLSSLFGPRKRSGGRVEFHHAIDMAACKGTPIKAAAAGRVIFAQNHSGFGNCVMVEHNNRYKTRYAHLNRILTHVGQQVNQGDVIGTVGDTGLVRKSGRDASHLHFEIHQDGRRVNPLAFLF